MEQLQELEKRENKNFYITFGVKYAFTKHPMGSHIHPNGYAVVQAKDEDEARTTAYAWYGPTWAFLYPEDDFDASYHPMGCIEALAVASDDGAFVQIGTAGL